MTPEAQRIAISRALGWRVEQSDKEANDELWDLTRPDGSVERYHGEEWCWHRVPDFPSDLNAMQEAQKVLTDDQWADYCFQVTVIVGGIDQETFRELLSATAAQRCEAFLRTIGKWEESK